MAVCLPKVAGDTGFRDEICLDPPPYPLCIHLGWVPDPWALALLSSQRQALGAEHGDFTLSTNALPNPFHLSM